MYPLFSTALYAYSTWNTLPSGENVVEERSYWANIERYKEEGCNDLHQNQWYSCSMRNC